MRIEPCHDIEELVPLAKAWLTEVDGARFGLTVNLETIKADLQNWMQTEEGIVLVGKSDTDPIGFIAVFRWPDSYSSQKIAFEKYWFVLKGFPIVGARLFHEALCWAKERNFSHFITSASHLSEPRCQNIRRFLQRTGAKEFDTLYIKELK